VLTPQAARALLRILKHAAAEGGDRAAQTHEEAEDARADLSDGS
jgi:plasmid stabilization system protein ParE